MCFFCFLFLFYLLSFFIFSPSSFLYSSSVLSGRATQFKNRNQERNYCFVKIQKQLVVIKWLNPPTQWTRGNWARRMCSPKGVEGNPKISNERCKQLLLLIQTPGAKLKNGLDEFSHSFFFRLQLLHFSQFEAEIKSLEEGETLMRAWFR